VNTFFAEAGPVNGKCDVLTKPVSVGGMIDWAA
jgi:hypothetical protein